MACNYLQSVLLPVDDDSCDLLVHENQDGRQQRGEDGGQCEPPRVFTAHGVDEPLTVTTRWLMSERKSMNCYLTVKYICSFICLQFNSYHHARQKELQDVRVPKAKNHWSSTGCWKFLPHLVQRKKKKFPPKLQAKSSPNPGVEGRYFVFAPKGTLEG